MSNQNYKRIVLVTDGLKSSEPVHETVFNLAKAHDAEVLIVDSVRAPSSALSWFSANAKDVFEMVLADKQNRLDNIANTFSNAGVTVNSKVLFGNSSEAITQAAVDWEASLVVRYMKGVRSKFPGVFGNTARSLMRFCPVPLLFVGNRAVSEPRVLACVDADHDRPENEAIIQEATRLSGAKDRLMGLYCWEMYGRDLVEKRMNPASFRESLDFAESLHRKSFERFQESNDMSMFHDFRMEYGEPSLLIPTYCRDQDIDVVVMCSATLNHPLKRYFGSTVEAVIEKIPCGLLVVKPKGFVSPIAECLVTTTV